jgi:nucleotide-binding universal stress UspA family protein
LHRRLAEHRLGKANTWKDDLIVMSTHSYRAFHRFLLGSVTSMVLHEAIARSGEALT